MQVLIYINMTVILGALLLYSSILTLCACEQQVTDWIDIPEKPELGHFLGQSWDPFVQDCYLNIPEAGSTSEQETPDET